MKHYAPNRCLYIKVAKLRTGVGSAETSYQQNCSVKLFKEHFKVQICKGRSFEKNKITFLAHLSRRLIGELIVYQWSGVRRCPQCSNIFFSQTTWPIKAKFYVEPPWVKGTKFCSRHLGHMTKMAATPIYGKNPLKIFFSRTDGPIFTKQSM